MGNDYPRVVPDLGEFAPEDGKPYRPSSGTEGDFFQDGWCEHCKSDRAFRENGYETTNGVSGCDILARSMAHSVGDKGYPVEWQYKDGEPICTAFDDVATQITNEERAANLELFKP